MIEDPNLKNGVLRVITLSLLRHQSLNTDKRFSIASQNVVRYLLRFPQESGAFRNMMMTIGNEIKGPGGETNQFLPIIQMEIGVKDLLIKLSEYSTEKFFNDYNQKLRSKFAKNDYVSETSSLVYAFVRDELDVKFYKGVGDLPGSELEEFGGDNKRTIGENVSRIYDAIMDGRVMGIL